MDHRKKKQKEVFQEKFRPKNLHLLTPDDYREFLYFKNNYAWTNLSRTGLKALKRFNELIDTLEFLLNEDIDIIRRINEVIKIDGKYHIHGIGKNIATAILHTADDQYKYGIWNNIIEKAITKLNIKIGKSAAYPGITYKQINHILNQIKKIINDDLVATDSLLWYIVHKDLNP